MSYSNRYLIDNAKIGNFIDIGACTGDISVLMEKKLEGTEYFLYSIDPDHEAFSQLERNTSGLKNIKLFQLAITNFDGYTKLFTSQQGGHTTNSSKAHTRKWNHDPNRFRENIVSKTLDTFVEENIITNLTAIKIDCEAGEQFVLEGASKTLKNNQIMISLETHGNIDCDAIFNILKDYGYDVFANDMTKVSYIEIGKDYICKNY